ncbi:MAG: hypothetical protein V7647_1370 [Acidobacteriota bacterium]|jgi:hypothetical protein
MQILRVYDPARRPPNWTDIIRPGQFVAFASHLETEAPCDPTGTPVPGDASTCVIYDSLGEATAFTREAVQNAPAVRFDIFDSAGRSLPPLLTVVHPGRVPTLDGNPTAARRNRIGALALVAAAPILFWFDWARHDGLLILPTVLGINMIIIATRLLQLNSAHASAARSRRERLAAHGGDPDA